LRVSNAMTLRASNVEAYSEITKHVAAGTNDARRVSYHLQNNQLQKLPARTSIERQDAKEHSN
jgi:hypothetical protein